MLQTLNRVPVSNPRARSVSCQALNREALSKAMAVRSLAQHALLHSALKSSLVFDDEPFYASPRQPPSSTFNTKTSATSSYKASSARPFEHTTSSTTQAHAQTAQADSSTAALHGHQAQVKAVLLHDLIEQEELKGISLVVQAEELTGQAAAVGGGHDSETPHADALADCGAEMDPLSAELDLEVNGMRMDLLAAVEEHANVAAQLEQQAGSDASSFTAEAAVGTNWVQAGKQLQARWQQLAYENMHLMVRIAQLRQLPEQPRRKITMAAVKEQQAHDLFFRRSMLTQRTSEMSARLRGM